MIAPAELRDHPSGMARAARRRRTPSWRVIGYPAARTLVLVAPGAAGPRPGWER